MGMAAADSEFHVLAVDDSLIDRKLVERLLKTSSFQVTTVDSGSKALEFLGYDLLKKMKESSSLRNIPVVIMSSENVPSRITRCLEEGAEDFFLKPMKLSDVNKLRPHMMKTKYKEDNIIEKPEKQEKQENNKEETTQESDDESPPLFSEHRFVDGLPPVRTRPRYNGLTVMSN
ncbi:hypothetical protein DH2020_038977 [Rehmannia glutinosa]|uniref:Response regulatory domain-containing protein n=1 Tax=Rehmannia glutinosa TaxID=99300 RepID=A0ABR0UX77_REHGL